ncbi:sel1 repeat family protein [Myxococcota bacterium]|nr:sel1 repeat family protein [Myxococcota bacterium]
MAANPSANTPRYRIRSDRETIATWESTRSPRGDTFCQWGLILLVSVACVACGEADRKAAPAGDGGTATAQELDWPPELAGLLERARGGDAKAQLALADRLEAGDGVPRNDAEALRWYRSAAEKGSVEALYFEGVMRYTGRGAPKDLEFGARRIQEAAERGNLAAQNSLGVLYAMGEGVEMNPAESMRWFRSAAEGGHASAQLSLGARLAAGYGGAKDPEESAQWYREAARNGLPGAQWRYGVVLARGEGVERDDLEAFVWLSVSGLARRASERALIEELEGQLDEVQQAEARQRITDWTSQRLN